MKDNPYVTDAELYRLVDGQLNDQEYRRILLLIAQSPGGWQRCAVAFLENQAMERELESLDFESLEAEIKSADWIWDELLNDDFASEDSLEPGVTAGKNNEKSNSPIFKSIASKSFVGMTLCLCAFVVVSMLQYDSGDETVVVNKAEATPVTNLIDVPQRDESLADSPEFLFDVGEISEIIPIDTHSITDYQADRYRIKVNDRYYVTPIQKTEITPRNLSIYR